MRLVKIFRAFPSFWCDKVRPKNDDAFQTEDHADAGGLYRELS